MDPTTLLLPLLPSSDTFFFATLITRMLLYLGSRGGGEEGGSREEKLRELPYRVIAWEIDSISIKTSLLLCSCNFVKINWLANPERRENYFVIRYFDTV